MSLGWNADEHGAGTPARGGLTLKIESVYRYGYWVRCEGQAAYAIRFKADLRHFEANGWPVIASRRSDQSFNEDGEDLILAPPPGWPDCDGNAVILEIDLPTPDETLEFVTGLWREAKPHEGQYYCFAYVFDVYLDDQQRERAEFQIRDACFFSVWYSGLRDKAPELQWYTTHSKSAAPRAVPRKQSRGLRKADHTDQPKISMHARKEYKCAKTALGRNACWVEHAGYCVLVEAKLGEYRSDENGELKYQEALTLTDWALDRALEALTEIEAWGAKYEGSARRFHAVPMTRPQAVRLKKLFAEIIASPLALYSPQRPTLSPSESIADIKLKLPKTKNIAGQVPAGFDWEAFDKQ
jgi:hypothetical protein